MQDIAQGAPNRQVTAMTSCLRACVGDVHDHREKQSGHTFGQRSYPHRYWPISLVNESEANFPVA